MPRKPARRTDFQAKPYFWMFVGLFAVLWLAGGASRADVVGQALVRFVAWAMLVALVLLAPRPVAARPQPVAIILGLSTALIAVQLLPLPPGLWTSLPGREMFREAALIAGQPQPWRPLSISPASTANALGAMIVPIAALVLIARIERDRHRQIMGLLIGLVAAGGLIGLLQFSGARFDNPLINDVSGAVSGNFANRNHFALFIAVGCLLLPVWGFSGPSPRPWRAVVAVGLLPFFILVGLATGSRSGIVLGLVGIAMGMLIVRKRVASELRRLPRRIALPLVIGILVLTVAAIVISISFDRAVAVNRALTLEGGADLRTQARPVVLALVAHYFPVGSGFGAFDAVFRIAEPDTLLRDTYFNHAHNDWLEIALDGGLPGLLLLGGAVLWWLGASVKAWRTGGTDATLARTGSTMIFLVFAASLTDYPARTPMVMALLVLAGSWLAIPAASSANAAGREGRRPSGDGRALATPDFR